MREIRFRGISLNREMCCGYLVQGELGTYIYAAPDNVMLVNPKTVGQFTGLKDQSGREIYEGDILRPITINASTTDGVVEFANGCFLVRQAGGEMLADDLFNYCYKAEVIGNIYESKP